MPENQLFGPNTSIFDLDPSLPLTFDESLLTNPMPFQKLTPLGVLFTLRWEVNVSLHTEFHRVLNQHYSNSTEAVVTLPILSDVAQSMGFSQRYLSDALKAETGVSAKEQVQRFLIDRAKDRLVQTDVSVTLIAEELGYESVQYFARVFKKKTGLTPTEFRQSLH